MVNTSIVQNKPKKIKLNFKDSKYATGEEKNQLLKYGSKKVPVIYM